MCVSSVPAAAVPSYRRIYITPQRVYYALNNPNTPALYHGTCSHAFFFDMLARTPLDDMPKLLIRVLEVDPGLEGITTRYAVEVEQCANAQGSETEWVQCIREDLLDDCEFEGFVDELPDAIFHNRSEAVDFIDTLRGLMHMGGEGVEFRIREIA